MQFAEHTWLIALPLITALFAVLYFAAQRQRKKQIQQFAAQHLLQKLLSTYSPARRFFKNTLILLGVIALLIGLARPQWGYEWQETKSKGIDILFILDSSKSMLAEDIRPNRLERSKLAILEFLDKLQGDRVGLVAFAGDAFLQCPLTLDYDAFRQSLEAINTESIYRGGTDIARAVEEAEAAFPDENNHKIIVLITDGEDLEEAGVQRASEAADNGVKIYTVGVGTAEGGLIPISGNSRFTEYLRDSNNELVRTQLDESTLMRIAESTGGFYVPLGSTGIGLEHVYQSGLQAIPKQEQSAQLQQQAIERFQWPLAATLLFLLWEPLVGTRKRLWRASRKAAQSVTSALLLTGLLAWTISDLEANSAKQLFEAGKFTESADAFREELREEGEDPLTHFNIGTALYESGEYSMAIASLKKALATENLEHQAHAFYNLGNAYYRSAFQGEPIALDSAEEVSKSEQSHQATTQALNQGNDILRRHAEASRPYTPPMLPPTTTLPSQEEIQQGIQIAEQAKAANEAIIEAGEEASPKIQQTVETLQNSIDAYLSSNELSPNEDAQFNADFVSDKIQDIQALKEHFDNNLPAHTQSVENLETLIEELKKLLDNQDQNQDQNQDSEENQDQENQENQDQENQENQDQENQENQDSQDQQGQDQEQSENQQNENSQNQDSQDSENSQQQNGEQSENGEEGQNNQNSQEEGEDEQAASSEEQGEEEGEQSQSSADDEEGESEEQNAQSATQGEGEQGEDAGQEQVISGVMSREQARLLLDSLKNSERKLPASGFRERQEDDPKKSQKRKDW